MVQPLKGEDYPALVRAWDNVDDSIYDDLVMGLPDCPTEEATVELSRLDLPVLAKDDSATLLAAEKRRMDAAELKGDTLTADFPVLEPLVCHLCSKCYFGGCNKVHEHSAWLGCWDSYHDIRECPYPECDAPDKYVHKHCAKDGSAWMVHDAKR